MTFISASNKKFAIRSERGSKSCLLEPSQVLVNLMCDWIIDLDFCGT